MISGRKEFLREVVGAPALIQSLIMLPQVEKYNRNVQRYLDEVKTGSRAQSTTDWIKDWFLSKLGDLS